MVWYPSFAKFRRSEFSWIRRRRRLPERRSGCERLEVSIAELTTDLSGVSVGDLRRRAVHGARLTTFLRNPETGATTHYVGSKNSSWQGKFYDKADGVVRVEFTLRRAFLRRKQIRRPAELLKLRLLDLSELVCFRAISRRRLELAMGSWSSEEKVRVQDLAAFRNTPALFIRFLRMNSIPVESVMRLS